MWRWLAGVEDEVRACKELGLAPDAPRLAISHIGLQVAKQINAAANFIQLMQHIFLYGSLQSVAITQDAFIKEDFKIRRTTENAKRLAAYDDATEGNL